MKIPSMKATLCKDHLLKVEMNKKEHPQGSEVFYLYENGGMQKELRIVSKSETATQYQYILNSLPKFQFGHTYQIFEQRQLSCTIDLSIAMQYGEQSCTYQYEGELGAVCKQGGVSFAFFSPLATEAMVSIETKTEKLFFPMKKSPDQGIFSVFVEGDFSSCAYTYLVSLFGEWREAVDPYAKAVTLQSQKSVIVDPQSIEVDLCQDALPAMNDASEAVIYEISVRDMTVSKETNIEHKATYSGLIEEGKITKTGQKAGLDYIAALGVTHVQILPIYDFATHSDVYPLSVYNWGYDPLYLQVPEGSYSLQPEDPLLRIKEVKQMIAAFHKKGIRVIIDMVFNHLFFAEGSAFDTLCPKYYFRYREDGSLSDGSFCGNELETRQPMVRKWIIDTCIYWMETYGVDGFRLDLMGLMDKTTLQRLLEEGKKRNPNFLLYGEGWDMPTILSGEEKGRMQNAEALTGIGFFNDRFRDNVKGKSGDYELSVQGYCLGDVNYMDAMKHCFLGSCAAIAMPPLFSSPLQSINYVECHDNATLFDKLMLSNYHEKVEDRLKRIKLLNAMTIFSYGIPFLHAGQEIGASKKGVHNAYNAGDAINQFPYELLEERMDMVHYVQDAIACKKQFAFLRLIDKEKMLSACSFSTLHQGILMIHFGQEIAAPFKEVKMMINPYLESYTCNLGSYYRVLFNEAGKLTKPMYAQNVQINGICVVLLGKE